MTAKEKLYALEKKLTAYGHAMGILMYDGSTTAPSATAANRGETLAMLSEESYKISTSEETRAILQELSENAESLDPVTKRIVTLRLRDMEEISKIPMDEYIEYQKLINESDDVWHKAKANDDYDSFAPYIDKIVAFNKRFASYVRPDMDAYDYALDRFEKGLTRETLDKFFENLRVTLAPTVALVKSAVPVDESPLNEIMPLDVQRKFSDLLMDILLLDRSHVGIGETEHPFTTSFTRHDVRITTNYSEEHYASSMYSVIHEGGHALYEANTDVNNAYNCAGNAASMAVHESQSRFYENIIGRSIAFVKMLSPKLKALCPALEKYTDEELYRAFNASKPSLIRTEADELFYSYHIMIRYELEKRLFTGEITAKELPDEWNKMYKEYLGVIVPNNREGVLQDTHWSGGMFGYFPSYALGSAYGAQLYARMKETVDIEGDVEKGDLTNINEWLRQNIWTIGSMLEPGEIMERAFGGKFDPSYYTNYLKEKYETIYG
ncbi:MAG: carboxypeptidase M32 [Clostridia bacterium]|nr:carboxypeptidase M32 [Clostridia bacterium]MBQ4156605.1 carboxypeptidase M32 [Clostridia bacterium]